jgi:hypothetical protein
MGIDYVLDLDCEAKRTLGIEKIVELVKARSRANAILGMAREQGDQRPAAEVTFKIGVQRAGKVETSEVSVQTLLDQATPLDAHAGGCATCPANRERATGYGCYDSISYPIEPDTEGFLLSRLPDDLDQPAGRLFVRAMKDFAWDGAQAAALRAQGETFFRLREAPVRSWPSGLSISGDQLFHMMFQVGHLGSSHAMMLCVFFGLLAMGDDPNPGARARTVAPRSANARQMVAFVNTLAAAAQAKCDLLIDG